MFFYLNSIKNNNLNRIATLTCYKTFLELKISRLLFKTAFLNYVCEVTTFFKTVKKSSFVNRIIVHFFFLLLCLQSYIFFGQYTEVINSNRPGFSESPYSLGTGVYQIESGLFYRNKRVNKIYTRPQNIGLDLFFRTGLFSEKLELNTNFIYQQDRIAFTNIFQSKKNKTLVRKFNVAAKYLIFQPTYKDKSKEIKSWQRKFDYDYNRLKPAIAIYAGLNTDVVDSFYKIGKATPKIGVLLQQNFTQDFTLINNFYYDNIGTTLKKYTYIITTTRYFGSGISSFLEYKGDFYSFEHHHNIGIGLAYLHSRNLQFNASARFLIEGKTSVFLTSIGASYRIDKHKDKFKNLDRIDVLKKETSIEKYNKIQNSFFKKNLRRKRKSRREINNRKRIKIQKRKPKKEKKEKKDNKEEDEIKKLEREIRALEEEMKKNEID